MATRKEIVVLIILILAIVSLVKIIEFFKVNVQEADASKFVLEDLYSKYPGADIEIMVIKELYNDQDEKYYEIKAKVTENHLTACPERMHIYYSYPVQNFITQPNEYITSGCKVCTEGICTIAFPEEAIIASHTFHGTEAVHEYVTTQNAVPSVTEDNNDWVVTWDSAMSTEYYIVTIGKNGNIESAEEIAKE